MRTIVEREPEWLEEDVDAALEWADWKASLCQCGHPRNETFDPKAEREWDAEALRCHACAARDRLARSRAEAENADQAGIYYVAKREPADIG